MTTQIDLINPALLFAAGGSPESDYLEGFAPGSKLYANLPADIYHADRDALSCSMLKPILISPADFQAALLAMAKSTKAKDFGSLVHALTLQPHLFNNDFALYPGLADGRDKDYQAFLERNPSRLVVDEPTFIRGRHLADKIMHRVVFGRPFGDFVAEGQSEVSIYVQEPTTGLLLRIRIDLYHPEFTFDLKTTRHGLPSAFLRDAVDMHYDLQAFMYTLVRTLYEGREKPVPFVFIAAQTEEPHSIHQITAGSSLMSNGAEKYKEVMTVYTACTQQDYWPDSSCDMVAEIDPWQAFKNNAPWKEALSSRLLTA